MDLQQIINELQILLVVTLDTRVLDTPYLDTSCKVYRYNTIRDIYVRQVIYIQYERYKDSNI